MVGEPQEYCFVEEGGLSFEDFLEEHADHAARLPEPSLDAAPASAREVAGQDKTGPEESRCGRVERDESPVGHPGHARHRRHECSEDAHEPAQKYRLADVPAEKALRRLPAVGTDPASEGSRLQPDAIAPPEPETRRVA